MVEIYLIRHGETEWTKSRQHTGLTDITLTENGRSQAKALARRTKKLHFDKIYVSPLKRAFDTCALCGYQDVAEVSNHLLEWDYGDFEGKMSSEIHKKNPNWNIFIDGAPNGESTDDVTKRVDHFLGEIKKQKGTVALFSSGHISRAIAARWLEMPISFGKSLILSTASLSLLSHEHNNPAIKLWNDTSHLLPQN